MIAEGTTTHEAAPDHSVDGAASAVVTPNSVLDEILADPAREEPAVESPPEHLNMLGRVAWYAEEGRRHLAYEPQDLLVGAVLETGLRVAALERELVAERAARVALEAQLAKVQEVLPSRARALGADAVERLRKVEPYALLVVLEDWGVGSFRHVRGAEVRLDHFPQLETHIRAGLLVGLGGVSIAEGEVIEQAQGSLRQRLAEQARLEQLRAEGEAAAAKARAEHLVAATGATA